MCIYEACVYALYSYVYVCRCVCVSGEEKARESFTAQETGVASQLRR